MDKATEARLCEIRSYVDSVRIRRDGSCVESKDLLALGKFAQDDFFGAILLAFTYGRAKGYQAATDAKPRQRKRRSPRAQDTTAAERVNG